MVQETETRPERAGAIDRTSHGAQHRRMISSHALAARLALPCLLILATLLPHFSSAADDTTAHRYLYAAVPGIRDYLQYGGHSVLVFDMDDGHKFVRRIASAGLNAKGQPDNVKGI